MFLQSKICRVLRLCVCERENIQIDTHLDPPTQMYNSASFIVLCSFYSVFYTDIMNAFPCYHSF